MRRSKDARLLRCSIELLNTFSYRGRVRFRIEYLVAKRKGAMLIARKLDPGSFALAEGAYLGPVPIRPSLSQPRALRPDGSPDLDLFVFWPRDWRTLRALQVGDELTLRPHAPQR